MKNKDPKFRTKVSEGLKRRKRLLGENYHSPSTKRKIGDATIKHWTDYPALMKVLYDNAQRKRIPGKVYNRDWYMLSQRHIRDGKCEYCGKMGFLHLHHIKPTRYGGTHAEDNLCVLCAGCHKRIEMMTNHLIRVLDEMDAVVEICREIIAAGISEYLSFKRIIAGAIKNATPERGEIDAERA